MKEGDLDNFNREYNDYRQKVGFKSNYQMLNDIRNNRLNAGNNNENNRDNQPWNIYFFHLFLFIFCLIK